MATDTIKRDVDEFLQWVSDQVRRRQGQVIPPRIPRWRGPAWIIAIDEATAEHEKNSKGTQGGVQ